MQRKEKQKVIKGVTYGFFDKDGRRRPSFRRSDAISSRMRKTIAALNAIKVRFDFSDFGKVNDADADVAAVGLDRFNNCGRNRLLDDLCCTFLDAVDRLDGGALLVAALQFVVGRFGNVSRRLRFRRRGRFPEGVFLRRSDR